MPKNWIVPQTLRAVYTANGSALGLNYFQILLGITDTTVFSAVLPLQS